MKSTDLQANSEEFMQKRPTVFSGSEMSRYPQYSESLWPKNNMEIDKSLRKEKVKEYRIQVATATFGEGLLKKW